MTNEDWAELTDQDKREMLETWQSRGLDYREEREAARDEADRAKAEALVLMRERDEAIKACDLIADQRDKAGAQLAAVTRERDLWAANHAEKTKQLETQSEGVRRLLDLNAELESALALEQAGAASLRQALESVSIATGTRTIGEFCFHCDELAKTWPEHGDPDCVVGKALSTSAGSEGLEAVRVAMRELEVAGAKLCNTACPSKWPIGESMPHCPEHVGVNEALSALASAFGNGVKP